MVLFRFVRDFDWRGPSRRCVLCKFATWAFKRSETAIEIPEDAAREAEAKGAGYRV